MDDGQLPLSDQMDSLHKFGIDISSDFTVLMDPNHQLPHEMDPATAASLGHFFHDDSCLDPQGSINCADSFKPFKASKSLSKKSPSKHSAMASTTTDHTTQAPSQDRQSNSSPVMSFSATESTMSYPWENMSLFNDAFLDTAHLSRPSNKSHDNPDQSKENCDDDCISILSCTSACGISCPSQCGDTGQGVCCDDDACGDACEEQDLCLDEACEDAATPCTDANCSGLVKLDQFPVAPGISDGDKQAAAALASIGDAQLAFMNNGFHHFHPDSHFESHSCFPGSVCSHTLPLGFFGATGVDTTAGHFWEYLNENPLATHILQYHDPRHSVDHVRPCMADHPNLAIPKCTLPKTAGGDALSHGLGHNNLEDFACGFEVSTVDQFANHIFEDHWHMHMSNSDLFGLSQPSQMEDRFSLVPSRTSISSYSLNGTSIHEPQFSPSATSMQNLSVVSSLSPPTSQATTPLVQPEELPTEPISAKLSPIPGGDSEAAVDCTCQWKIAGGKICGMQFKDANDLHNHTKNDHLKEMTRQHPGFRCHWEGCTRTTVFGQKSKLERHIQTHTGCKSPIPALDSPQGTNGH